MKTILQPTITKSEREDLLRIKRERAKRGAEAYVRVMARSREHHPLAKIFPMFDRASLKELADDIRSNGLRQAIVTYQRKVLDGRNRLKACEIAGVEPRFEEYRGVDPLGYVISLNLKRRHLNTTQRATVAAKIANIKHGGDRVSEQDANGHLEISRQEAAKMMNVSPRSVARAHTVLTKGTPELVKSMESGEISARKAAEALREPERASASHVKTADKYLADQEAKLGPAEIPEAPMAGDLQGAIASVIAIERRLGGYNIPAVMNGLGDARRAIERQLAACQARNPTCGLH